MWHSGTIDWEFLPWHFKIILKIHNLTKFVRLSKISFCTSIGKNSWSWILKNLKFDSSIYFKHQKKRYLVPKWSPFLGYLPAVNYRPRIQVLKLIYMQLTRRHTWTQKPKQTSVICPCPRAVSSVLETLCQTLLASWHPLH